jgi:hypothetical protein
MLWHYIHIADGVTARYICRVAGSLDLLCTRRLPDPGRVYRTLQQPDAPEDELEI